ncbi:PucR family transcriptional regulator [Clostridium sp. YIM B02551]|uniref:PucR family transcriptional regulator n=1 Tax=Clostridium sp. YIM B02551 TaxID=2910679 RepID=UPI001EEAEFCD|nr:PucR family transcriptional regulator [Clostridium sp. YIM B02551]
MYITYDDLLSLPQMKKAKVVSGEKGLDKFIEWSHVVELPDAFNWINSGELIFTTGIGLENHEKDLLRIVEELYKKSAAGLVLVMGPYIKEIPNSVKVLSNKCAIPILEIPYEIRAIDITYSMSRILFDNYIKDKSMNDLMRELIYQEFNEEFYERAVYYGYNPQSKYVASTIQVDNLLEDLLSNKSIVESKNLDIGAAILNIVRCISNKYKKSIFYILQGTNLIYFLPISNEDQWDIEINKINSEIKDTVCKKLNGLTVSIGIGEPCNDLKYFKRSVGEAQKALKILKACERSNDLRSYKELGIYRIFFRARDNEELMSIYNGVLKDLIEYDKKNNSDLVHTLDIFLAEDCNIGKTAEELFIHRNTLKYRITRIQEILSCDFENVNECFTLRLAYKIKKFIGYVEPNLL